MLPCLTEQGQPTHHHAWRCAALHMHAQRILTSEHELAVLDRRPVTFALRFGLPSLSPSSRLIRLASSPTASPMDAPALAAAPATASAATIAQPQRPSCACRLLLITYVEVWWIFPHIFFTFAAMLAHPHSPSCICRLLLSYAPLHWPSLTGSYLSMQRCEVATYYTGSYFLSNALPLSHMPMGG